MLKEAQKSRDLRSAIELAKSAREVGSNLVDAIEFDLQNESISNAYHDGDKIGLNLPTLGKTLKIEIIPATDEEPEELAALTLFDPSGSPALGPFDVVLPSGSHNRIKRKLEE